MGAACDLAWFDGARSRRGNFIVSCGNVLGEAVDRALVALQKSSTYAKKHRIGHNVIHQYRAVRNKAMQGIDNTFRSYRC